MILKLNAKNKKYILYILLIVIVLAIYSRLNLNITYVKEDKHDSLNIQNVHINNQRAAATDSIVKVQEVFRKEDVIALIQKHLNERKKEIETSKIKYDYLKRYPNFLECNKKIIEKWSVNAMYTNDNQQIEYSKPASNETHKHRFVKGILVYFPIEKTNEFIPEFKWLYRSWIEMQKSEPNMWRTDLVVFIEKSVHFLQELNCTFQNKRKHDSDEPMCTLLEYIAVKNRNLTELSNPLFKKENIYEPIDVNKNIYEKYEYLLNNVEIFSDDPANLLPFLHVLQQNLYNYGYLDSILMAFEGYSHFKAAGYDYLIRSDMDVFLTPLFAKWLPKHCNDFVVGGGGYSDQFNANRIKRIANDLKFEHAGQWNLGSTWFSTPDQFRLVSYLTLFGMAYIGKEEFSLPEREGKAGTELWPAWHYGVLLLYGQNLGMNHLIGAKQINVPKLFNYIDHPSSNPESVNDVIHIHVYHGGDIFSKFAFKMGQYDNMTVPTVDTHQIKNYCLKMALESKRTTCTDLVKQLREQINKKQ